MIENVFRTVLAIVILLGVALALLLFKDPPFNLGLDLQGGTRLEYRLDIEGARERGAIPATTTDAEILAETINTIRQRIDPTGVLEANLRAQPPYGVVIELPGTLSRSGVTANGALAEPLDVTAMSVTLGANAETFPEAGGVVSIGGEQVRYASRSGNVLQIEPTGRGIYGTAASAHTAGTPVTLVQSDWIREQIENLGELMFVVRVTEADLIPFPEVDLAGEQEKMQAFLEANPGSTLQNFNDLAFEEGGPFDGPDWSLEWYPFKENETQPVPEAERALAVKIYPAGSAYEFTGEHLAKVFPTVDSVGFSAVGFEMEPAKKTDFGNFTEENIEQTMPVILNGTIETAPTIRSRLPGGGIIEGRYTEEEVMSLVSVLRSGSLRIKPTLQHQDKVGATLGADYVERGWKSGLVALALVLVFMGLYYRRLGFYAILSLLSTSLMLMGGLAFLDATLTLPGIAGIILTVGMAVDANILIFDRVREELDKGRSLKQGTKTGFDKAFSAIFDANVTTLLTAIILYKFGTGPVRGFAVTLMVGILTSVFSALVITRLLVHLALERGASRFNVGSWMVEANYNFLGRAKIAFGSSLLVMAGALAYFVILPDSTKLGIDFLGGTELQIATRAPMNADEIRALVGTIPGEGENAQVQAVLSSAEGDGYTSFRVVSKSTPGAATETGGGEFQDKVALALADALLDSPIEVGEVRQEGTQASVDVRLIFDQAHPADDIAARLGEAGLTNANVRSGERLNSFEATGLVQPGREPTELAAALENAFAGESDSTGEEYTLAEAIPTASKVGPQVVGELQEKAIFALLLSLFGIVLYIRVRFAEYSYGIAAVAALTHDVVITLGVLMVANTLGIVNGEINLPMIAVFLTIIGYSLNDTIIIFDRVRENLPVMQKPLREILNTSINQTLSRTVLTSGTTFIAVAVMYVFNFGTGNVLESFSFAMMIGIISGTYSTIFIANPVLLWLERRARDKRRASGHMRERDRLERTALEGN